MSDDNEIINITDHILQLLNTNVHSLHQKQLKEQ